MERPEATKAEGSVRATGTGRPEPASPKTQAASASYARATPKPRYGGASFSRIRLTRIRSAPGVESNISARAS